MTAWSATAGKLTVSGKIGLAHLAAGLVLLCVYLYASLTAIALPVLSVGFAAILAFIVSGAAQLVTQPARKLAVWLFAALDILIFSYLIWSMALLYDGLVPAALGAPTNFFLFALIALYALHASAPLVMFAGGIAIGARLAMDVAGLLAGGTFTSSYAGAIASKHVVLSGEGEIVLAIALFCAVLAWVVRARAVPAQEALDPAPADEAPVAMPKSAIPAGEPTRILVAEDSAVNMMVLDNMFRDRRFAMSMTEDGREAVAAFARMAGEGAPPDIVLLDIEMPEMDGHEAAREIRRLERESGLPARPIIAVTALADDASRQASLAAGMDDHLVKPVRRAILLESIAHAFARHRRG